MLTSKIAFLSESVCIGSPLHSRDSFTANDFKPLCERLKVNFKEFKKEAHTIAELYERELPSYIEEIKSLGSIPFYRKIQKTKIGEGSYLKASKEPIEFHEVLSKFHKMRVEHLKEHGWII